MSESNITIDRSSVLCKTFIKFDKQITFTSRQIENLFKLQLLNMKPQECVTWVYLPYNLLLYSYIWYNPR